MKEMKKYLLLLAVVIFSCAGAMAFDKYSVNREDLPKEAQEFLTKHFPKSKVAMVKVDKHLLRKTDYDVKLVNGTKIEFNNAGQWTSVDCKGREVPASIIPKSIQKYVSDKFPEETVIKIDKKAAKFEVDLSGGIELTFDRLGNFKKMEFDD